MPEPPAFSVIVPNFGNFALTETLLRIIDTAEELEYHGVWFADHIFIPGYAKQISSPNFYESLSLCTFGLARTNRLRFGTDIMVLPYRHPVVLAKMVATIDRLSGGRFILGVGVGFLRGEFEALGASYARRAQLTEEYVRVIRTLWESPDPVAFQGEVIHFEDMYFEPRPDSVPIFIGGNSARAHHRAADLGDGWHPLWPGPQDYARARDVILARRHEAGRAQPFTFSYSCPLTRILDEPPPPVAPSVAEESEATMEQMRAQRFLPEDYDFSPPGPLTPEGRLMFFGTAEQVTEDIRALQTAGVDHFALRFSVGAGEIDLEGFLEQMQRFAREVKPILTR